MSCFVNVNYQRSLGVDITWASIHFRTLTPIMLTNQWLVLEMLPSVLLDACAMYKVLYVTNPKTAILVLVPSSGHFVPLFVLVVIKCRASPE